MSIADKLGTGSSFSHVPRGRSARGRAKAVVQGDVPTYELVRLHLDEVSPTPLNPRRNFGTEEELTRFGEELRQAQLAACVAVTRNAYLALWPEHEERIGSAKHVLVNGERRYRSGVHVGLDALDFVVRDDLASSREQFINHLLKENLDREDFDVIERARGVQQLVDICAEKSERGARSRAAEQLGKDRSWVTNQLALLELPEELQVMLSAGSLPERDGRVLARHLKDNPGLDAPALLDHLEQTKTAAAMAKEQEKAALEAVRATQASVAAAALLSTDNNRPGPVGATSEEERQTGLLSADNKPSGPTAGADELNQSADSLSADNSPSGQTGARSNSAGAAKRAGASDNRETPTGSSSPVPGQRHDQSANATEHAEHQGDGQPRKLPYDDPTYVAMHLQMKMEPADFLQTTRRMTERCWDTAGQEPTMELLRDLLTAAAQRDPDSLRTLLVRFTTEATTS